VTVVVDTIDKATGKKIFENQGTVVLRGSGGFGGKKSGSGTHPSTSFLRMTLY
jgi:multifunctional beta-oxidation protein